MNKNLYDELGISKKAHKDEVRQAFRQRAKFVHPDAGGSAAEFRRLQLAYRVLSDDDARANYDATGSVEPPPLDTAESDLCDLILQIIDISEDPATIDVLEIARARTLAKMEELQTMVTSEEKRGRKFLKAAALFSRSAGDNVIKMALESTAAKCAAASAKLHLNINRINKCLALIKEYKYKYKSKASSFVAFASNFEQIISEFQKKAP